MTAVRNGPAVMTGAVAANAGPRSRGPQGAGADRSGAPPIPDNATADRLEPGARAELRTLPSDLADAVGRRLVAAELEADPERAYAHARVARDLAARVGVVREAAGIAAYRVGKWAEALSELRAARRLTGRETYLPMMADSERALGRLDRALAVVHSPEAATLDRASQIELLIVESGIRRDQGRPETAVIVLQVPELTDRRPRPWSAALFYAYADALLAAGRTEDARAWFARAAAADTHGDTDAEERFQELEGITLEDLDPTADDDEDEDEDEDDGAEDDADGDGLHSDG